MTATQAPSKTEELLQRLADGGDELHSPDGWQRWLRVQPKFYGYSFGNTLLVCLQRPEATHVTGFHRWLALGRHVRMGGKGTAILAPVAHRIKFEDDDGERHTLTLSLCAFRVVHVFDIAQTDGADLPPTVRVRAGPPACPPTFTLHVPPVLPVPSPLP